MKRQLHLNLFIHSRGHHEASWRHPASSPLPLTDIRYYQDLAQRAEAALFDSIFLRRPAGAGRRCGPGAAHLARADHRTGGDGGGDEPGRADRNRLDHLHRTLQSGAAVRLDRPHQQRPRGLEHRDLVARDRGGELRRRRAGQPRRPLRPRRGVHGGREGAVGQLGRGCGHRRPGRRCLCATRPHQIDQSSRRFLYGGRAAQHAALPAGPAGAGAGGLVRHRSPLCRAACRCRVHRPYGEGDGAGILCRSEGAGGGRGTAAGAGADPARPQPDDRRDRNRGAAPGARGQRAHRSGGRAQAAVGPLRRVRFLASAARPPALGRRISPTRPRSRRRAAAPR